MTHRSGSEPWCGAEEGFGGGVGDMGLWGHQRLPPRSPPRLPEEPGRTQFARGAQRQDLWGGGPWGWPGGCTGPGGSTPDVSREDFTLCLPDLGKHSGVLGRKAT